ASFGEPALKIFPNPAHGVINFALHLNTNSHIRLSLFDELGREIIKAIDEDRNEGYYRLQLDTKLLGTSVVFARLEIGGKVFTQRLVIAD
ncbi:MAG: T9SS type A sorting domain-containing protein, partial [Ignavibacteriota bacterium]